MKLLSPRIDLVFKMLFAKSGNEDILSDFIASVLDVDPQDVANIKVIDGEIKPEDITKKFSRLDILVEVGGRKVNIEMQVRSTLDFIDRVVFYATKVFVGDLRSGHPYSDLEQTISINILDYNIFEAEDCHSTFMLKETKRDEILTDKLRIDFLELPKTESDQSIQVKRLKKWLRFLNIKSEEEAEMIAQGNDEMINKAVYVLREISADDAARRMAWQREKALHDEASYMRTARLEGQEALLAQLRALGVDETKLSRAVSNLQNK